MRVRVQKCLLLAAVLISIASVQAQDQNYGFELIGGMYQPSNAAESFDEVYGGPGPLVGLGGYWINSKGLSVEARSEYFFVSGDRTHVGAGDTGYSEDLTMISLQASCRYHLLREASISPYLLAGLGFYSLSVKSEAPDSDVTSSSAGAHLGGGIDFLVGTPVNVGLEARYSMIPNLIGEGGLSSYYDETDFGGYAILAKVSFVFGLD